MTWGKRGASGGCNRKAAQERSFLVAINILTGEACLNACGDAALVERAGDVVGATRLMGDSRTVGASCSMGASPWELMSPLAILA